MSSSSSWLEALVGPRREVVGERLDSLFDGATRFAQATVIPDQVASARPIDHLGRSSAAGRWWMRPNFSAGMPMSRGDEDVRLEAAGRPRPQGRDVPVATVLAQQGRCVEQAGGRPSGIGIARSAAYMGRPSDGALVAALINRSAARAKAGESTRSPRIRRSAFTTPLDEP